MAFIKNALNAAVSIPTIESVLEGDRIISDGSKGLKDMQMDQFKLHLLSAIHAEDVSKYFEQYEANYKKVTGDKRMPGHYRSNKSVLLQCESLGINVTDATGFPLGKTALEKLIKAAKEDTSPIAKALKCLDAVESAYSALETDAEKSAFTIAFRASALRNLI